VPGVYAECHHGRVIDGRNVPADVSVNSRPADRRFRGRARERPESLRRAAIMSYLTDEYRSAAAAARSESLRHYRMSVTHYQSVVRRGRFVLTTSPVNGHDYRRRRSII